MCMFSVNHLIEFSFQHLVSTGLSLTGNGVLGLVGVCFWSPALIQHVVPCWLGCTVTGAQGLNLLVMCRLSVFVH